MNKWINADALNFRFVHGRWDSRYVREDEVLNAPGPVVCEECKHWAKEKNRGGSRQDKFAAYAARMESLEKRRDSLMRRIRRLERAVEEWIRMQPRDAVRECLRLRHIEGLAWRKIARRMQYSLPAVRKMEQVALKMGRERREE